MHPQFIICTYCGSPAPANPYRVRRFCSRTCGYAFRHAQAYAGTPETRFWAHVDRSPGPTACWARNGRRTPHYSKFQPEARVWIGAHVFAYVSTFGPLPPDKPFVLHKCPGGSNRWCVNPAHLTAGTGAENAADRKAAGRDVIGDHRGERNPKAKLDAPDVLAIRRDAADGVSQYRLAKQRGVTQATISAIVRRQTWRHL